jgi:aspartate 1-decarboxylase
MRIMLKSKIHRARVTEVNLDYEGSIAIDKRLMDEADILPYEQVHVLDVNNGARFTTYAIEAPADSGTIGIRGAAARLVAKGDIVIILSYCNVEEAEAKNFLPRLVYVDENNVITRTKHIVNAIPF